jgi:hypothetical protein
VNIILFLGRVRILTLQSGFDNFDPDGIEKCWLMSEPFQ